MSEWTRPNNEFFFSTISAGSQCHEQLHEPTPAMMTQTATLFTMNDNANANLLSLKVMMQMQSVPESPYFLFYQQMMM